MADFLFYYIWIIIGFFEILFLYRKCIYDCTNEHGISLQRYIYFFWIIACFIPLINLGLGIVIPIIWLIEGYSFKCKLIEKLKETKFIQYLNKKV